MNAANMTAKQQQGRAAHLQYQRETMTEFIRLLKEAEALAAGSGCIGSEGLALYTIRNTVSLKLRDLPAE